jgi:hypothetical protein
LVANVLADQLRAQLQSVDVQPPDQDGLEAFVRFYLSAEHRDQCADDCSSAALRDEIVRRPDATRQVFTDELLGVIDDIAARLDPTEVAAARTDALTVFGLMVGTLQVARALTDRDLSDQLLARGAQTALALLDDRASNAGVTREQARACGVIGAAVASSVSGRLSPVGDLRGVGARVRPRARRAGSHPSAGWARARGRSTSRPPWR